MWDFASDNAGAALFEGESSNFAIAPQNGEAVADPPQTEVSTHPQGDFSAIESEFATVGGASDSDAQCFPESGGGELFCSPSSSLPFLYLLLTTELTLYELLS